MAGILSDTDKDIQFLLKALPTATEQEQGLFCDYVEGYVDDGMSNEIAREYALRDLLEARL